MFTQFFGSYLLNHNYISADQLARALEHQKYTRLRMGVLAINAGYLTATQVEQIHTIQAKKDQRFGDIAVELGYITRDQLDALLVFQRSGHLLLGQTLINHGVMSNDSFENALNGYMRENSITDMDFTFAQNEKISTVIKKFYHFSSYKSGDIYTDFVTLLFKNIIRFIGDDFTPLEPNVTQTLSASCFTMQEIDGEFSAFTAIEGEPTACDGLACRYAAADVSDNIELVRDSMSEFLNLHNGLFTVNMSNDRELELELKPQTWDKNKDLMFNGDAFCIPIRFPFGMINFVLSGVSPIMK